MRVRAVVFVAVLSTTLGLPALACSICGCDPAAGTLGLDRPSASSLRLAIEDRYLAKESGTAGKAESEREDRLLLRAQFRHGRFHRVRLRKHRLCADERLAVAGGRTSSEVQVR